MSLNDCEYYLARARDEAEQANVAMDPHAALIHRDLAEKYARAAGEANTKGKLWPGIWIKSAASGLTH